MPPVWFLVLLGVLLGYTIGVNTDVNKESIAYLRGKLDGLKQARKILQDTKDAIEQQEGENKT